MLALEQLVEKGPSDRSDGPTRLGYGPVTFMLAYTLPPPKKKTKPHRHV